MSSRSINKVTLLGNLTRDPLVKYTTSGTAVATFAIATNRTWTTSEGTIKEDVQYHNIVAWSKLAELVGKLLTKGKKVYVDGRLTSRKYTDKNNIERYITEIVMEDFIVFGDGVKRADGAYEAPHPAQSQAAEHDDETDTTGAAQAPAPAPSNQSVNPDDIPF